ncbi:hypothetical protein [Leptospira noguchii]|uniref:Uncharacterized protein n=1 Tax=Leptospira noguchii TaxID=28182 RepID=A0A9Q8VX84_9LEPT|nr:hypothetical protein [Leptospira noguchii]TQE74534.1 hypothetical protein FF021_10925 [Leptospira noguchii]UOG53006.1 hypothetical protein MAL09_01885 [Leptospira noguchii]UOG56890.1 hypothetical protein MAL03_01295 [Leptospira noguchii]
MNSVKHTLTKEELMELNEIDSQILKKCILPNSDEETNEERWVENGKTSVEGFFKQATIAINLLLGRKD